MDAVTPPRRPHDAAHPAGRRRAGGGRGRVGAIALAAGRNCSRPGCGTPAGATLAFSYGERTARLVALLDERDPQAYDLCEPHASRTRPPREWELVDARPARPAVRPPAHDDVDGTVALLAGVLHGTDTAPLAEAPRTTQVDEHGLADADGDVGDEDVPDGADQDPELSDDLDPDAGEDPLRAALEEVQRVVVSDPLDDPAPPPTPLRRRVLIVDADDPDAEPTLW